MATAVLLTLVILGGTPVGAAAVRGELSGGLGSPLPSHDPTSHPVPPSPANPALPSPFAESFEAGPTGPPPTAQPTPGSAPWSASPGSLVPLASAVSLMDELTANATGTIGSWVNVAGSGFSATQGVSLTWSSTSVLVGSCTTNASGGIVFPCLFAVPANSPNGGDLYQLEVCTPPAGTCANASFQVVPGSSMMDTATGGASGHQGDYVTISGDGFAASAALSVHWDLGGADLGVGCSTDLSGNIVSGCAFTVPLASYDGTAEVLVAGPASTYRDVAVTPFSVLDPAVTVPIPSVGSADQGQVVNFSSTLSDPGSGSDTYSWSTSPVGLGCGPSTGLGLSCVPTGPGSYTANLTVTDSSGGQGTAVSAPFTVYGDPALGGIGLSAPQIDLGQSISLMGRLMNYGSGGLMFNWSGLPPGCAPTDAPVLSCSPSATGSYTVDLIINDSNGVFAPSVSRTLNVSGAPVLSSITAIPSSVDVGQLVTFNVTLLQPGAGTVSPFLWSGLGPSCSSNSSRLGPCAAPQTPGSYAVVVTVVDSDSYMVNATIDLVVHLFPSVSTPRPSRPAADVGQSVIFGSSVTDSGTGSTVLSWNAPLGLGCAGSSTLTFACTPTQPGTYLVTLSIVDGTNGNGSSSLGYTVLPDPTVVVGVSSPSIDLGGSLELSAAVVGGAGGEVWAWTGLPPGCPSRPDPTIDCAPSSSGTFPVRVNASDSNGYTAESSAVSLVVNPELSLVLSASTSSPSAREAVQFTAEVTGGSAPLSYAWRFGDGGASTLAAPQHDYASPGTYTVVLWVNDSSGASSERGTVVTVHAARSGFLGLPGNLGYELVGAATAVAALVVATLLVVLRTGPGHTGAKREVRTKDPASPKGPEASDSPRDTAPEDPGPKAPTTEEPVAATKEEA